MDKIKLDLKDKKILEELDWNPNITYSKLAKNVGVSRQVAEYRVNKLVSQKTIYGFYTLVDVGKIGYSSFRINVRLKNVGKESHEKFAKNLFDEYPTFWVGFVLGKFDLLIDMFAKNSNEFEKLFNKILQENKDIIQDYEILPILGLDFYNYGYFINSKKGRKKTTIHKNVNNYNLDPIDGKILRKIKNNSRFSYVEIGEELKISRNTVKNRISRLQKEGIIAGYKPLIDFNHLRKNSFQIFLKYNNSKIYQEKHLLNFLQNKKGILVTIKLLGRWDRDIEIHSDSIKDLQKFIIDLRNKFEIIEDYEIVHIIGDYGMNFYPDKI